MPGLNPFMLLMIKKAGEGTEDDESLVTKGVRAAFLQEDMEDDVPDSAKSEAVPPEVTEWMNEQAPLQGYQIKKGLQSEVSEGLGVYPQDIAWAKYIGRKYEGEVDGKGDAARHLALGWLAKRSRVNPEAAAKLIDLREYFPPRREFERDQDIGNNRLGAEIEAETYEEAEKEIARMLEEDDRVIIYTPTESRQKRGY